MSEKIIDGALKWFGGNNQLFTIFLLFVLLIYWLFKEFRKKVIDDEKYIKEHADIILKSLIDLKFEIGNYLTINNNFEIVREKITIAFPFMTNKLSVAANKLSPKTNDNEFNQFLENLEKDIRIVKQKQVKQIALAYNEYSILYYLESNLKLLLIPFIITMIATLLIMLVAIISILILASKSVFGTMLIYFRVFDLILLIFNIYMTLVLNVRVKTKCKTFSYAYIISFVSLIFLGVMAYYRNFKHGIQLNMALLLFIYYLVSIGVIFIKSFRKSKKNI